MSKINDFLNLRLKTTKSDQPKMTQLANRATQGNLSSFSGIFRVTALDEKEENALKIILNTFRPEDSYDVEADLKLLATVTSEVKAIANQAIILHGERVKRAQEILKTYRDGAFTSWLYAAYGNRQTPYNFLQYYEFYLTMPQELHAKIDQMPRQAIYTLASRNGTVDQKEKIIQDYTGQPKNELLAIIRREFPLAVGDKRLFSQTAKAVRLLKQVLNLLQLQQGLFSKEDQEQLLKLLDQLRCLALTRK